MNPRTDRPRVGLFVTCLADLFRPSVAFAAVQLLESAGYRVEVPRAQTCCGQPAYNNGDRENARALALQTLGAFESFDYVVAPSGSCAGQIKIHYPRLFDSGSSDHARALALASRTYELFGFLVTIARHQGVNVSFPHVVTYHDSCSGLRELGIRAQPRRLLADVKNLELRELDDPEACCGFGGTFCVKYPAISERMVDKKIAAIERTGAEYVLGGDLGCLMNIAGRLKRRGSPIKVLHAAEVLAGTGDTAPAIGEMEQEQKRKKMGAGNVTAAGTTRSGHLS